MSNKELNLEPPKQEIICETIPTQSKLDYALDIAGKVIKEVAISICNKLTDNTIR